MFRGRILFADLHRAQKISSSLRNNLKIFAGNTVPVVRKSVFIKLKKYTDFKKFKKIFIFSKKIEKRY